MMFFHANICVDSVGPTLSLNLEFVPSLLAVLCKNGQKFSLKYTVDVYPPLPQEMW
ncbi:hypothetical protein ACP70R_028612 [Stipagrostis hirtigluma subsp. patula]